MGQLKRRLAKGRHGHRWDDRRGAMVCGAAALMTAIAAPLFGCSANRADARVDAQRKPLLVEDASASAPATPSIAALRALATPALGTCRPEPGTDAPGGGIGPCCMMVLGYRIRGDGGGGQFCWDQDATVPDDAGTIIQPSGSPASGRWLRTITDNTYDIRWFGAVCDGSTDDTAAFQSTPAAGPPTGALVTANLHGGTILIPGGQVCRVTQLNLGKATPTGDPSVGGQSARGITIRGAANASLGTALFPRAGVTAYETSVAPSTIFIEPASGSAGNNCVVLANNDNAVTDFANGGIAIGPNVSNIYFADLALVAGPSLSTCIVNISHSTCPPSTPGGDPENIRFQRVSFVGNGTNTDADVFLGNASYVSFENSNFGGATQSIRNTRPGTDCGPDRNDVAYANNISLVRNLFISANYAVPQLVFDGQATALQIVANAFEQGPNAIGITFGLRGGEIADNYFSGEGVTSSNANWINLACVGGCTISGNRIFGGGFNGISINGPARITGNSLAGDLAGTPIIVSGNGATVQNNTFEGSTATQTDIIVGGGVGHEIGPNVHAGAKKNSVYLSANTRGTLHWDIANDNTINKVADASLTANGPGGWIKFSNNTFMSLNLPVDASDSAHLVVDNLSGIGGGFLNLETAAGQNATLVLNDTMPGGQGGGIRIDKVGTTTVKIAGAAGSGPTFFDAGDYVGIGTATPNAQLEVRGGLRINTPDAKPQVCDVTLRGEFWVDQSDGGDTVSVCVNTGAGYAWKKVTLQ
jgi:hypothetical protein